MIAIVLSEFNQEVTNFNVFPNPVGEKLLNLAGKKFKKR